MYNAGSRVELLDFSDSCEFFVTYSGTGEIALWSIRERKFQDLVHKLTPQDMPWSKMRIIREDRMVIGYSRLHRKFVFVKRSLTHGQEPDIQRLDPSKIGGEDLGELGKMQIDNTQQFLVAVFPAVNKLIVIDINH